MLKTLDFYEGGLCSALMTNLTGPEWDTGKKCGDFCDNNAHIGANYKPYKHLQSQWRKKGTLNYAILQVQP